MHLTFILFILISTLKIFDTYEVAYYYEIVSSSSSKSRDDMYVETAEVHTPHQSSSSSSSSVSASASAAPVPFISLAIEDHGLPPPTQW